MSPPETLWLPRALREQGEKASSKEPHGWRYAWAGKGEQNALEKEEKNMRFLSRRAFSFLIPSLAAAQQAPENNRHPAVLPTKAYPFESLTMRAAQTTKTYPILNGNTH